METTAGRTRSATRTNARCISSGVAARGRVGPRRGGPGGEAGRREPQPEAEPAARARRRAAPKRRKGESFGIAPIHREIPLTSPSPARNIEAVPSMPWRRAIHPRAARAVSVSAGRGHRVAPGSPGPGSGRAGAPEQCPRRRSSRARPARTPAERPPPSAPPGPGQPEPPARAVARAAGASPSRAIRPRERALPRRRGGRSGRGPAQPPRLRHGPLPQAGSPPPVRGPGGGLRVRRRGAPAVTSWVADTSSRGTGAWSWWWSGSRRSARRSSRRARAEARLRGPARRRPAPGRDLPRPVRPIRPPRRRPSAGRSWRSSAW